jgi:hypothetical protein
VVVLADGMMVPFSGIERVGVQRAEVVKSRQTQTRRDCSVGRRSRAGLGRIGRHDTPSAKPTQTCGTTGGSGLSRGVVGVVGVVGVEAR